MSFVQFDNPTQMFKKGGCCDGYSVPGIGCFGTCDQWFYVCMNSYRSKKRDCDFYLKTYILAEKKTRFNGGLRLGIDSKGVEIKNPWKFKLDGEFVSCSFSICFKDITLNVS